MISTRTSLLPMLLALLVSSSAVGRPVDEPKPPSKEDVEAAVKAAEKKAAELNGQILRMQPITDDVLTRLFPGRIFVAGYVPTFPVARLMPQGSPLKQANLFVVRGDRVSFVTDLKGLQELFHKDIDAARGEERLKDIVRGWLLLTQSFHQDGFYRFKLADDATKLTPGDAGTMGSGLLTVASGGSGTLAAVLTFDEAGKLAAVKETASLRPGPRPICQATKLLDPDPIVRRMAEQDLLIMGRPAWPYLQEQRGKASPKLQKAIDQLWQRILREDRGQ